jgi:hypothetical protein
MDWGAIRLEGASERQFVGTVVACGTLFFALDVIYERVPLSCAGAVAPWAAMATWIHFHRPGPITFPTALRDDLDETILLSQLGQDKRLIELGIQFFSLSQDARETEQMQSTWDGYLSNAQGHSSVERLGNELDFLDRRLASRVFAWDESGQGTQDVSILMNQARTTGVIHFVTLNYWLNGDAKDVNFSSSELAGQPRSFRVSDALREVYFG